MPESAPQKKDERGTAIYVRCSLGDGDHPIYQSVKAQIDELKPLAEKHGIEYASIYGDNGGTGMDFWREGFQLLLSHARSGLVGRILMTDRSRLGCEYRSVIQAEEIFRELGVEIIYARTTVDDVGMTAPLQRLEYPLQILLGYAPEGEEEY